MLSCLFCFKNTANFRFSILYCFSCFQNTTSSISSMLSYFFCFKNTANSICSMLSCLFCFQNTINYICLCFPAFSASRTQQTLCFKAFLLFLLSGSHGRAQPPPSLTPPLDLVRKHKKQKSIEQIEFSVFWKQKQQESTEHIEFVVFWKHKKQKHF